MILEENFLNSQAAADKICINLPKKVDNKFRPNKKRKNSKKSRSDSAASATSFYQGLSCSLSPNAMSVAHQSEVIELEDIAVLSTAAQ